MSLHQMFDTATTCCSASCAKRGIHRGDCPAHRPDGLPLGTVVDEFNAHLGTSAKPAAALDQANRLLFNSEEKSSLVGALHTSMPMDLANVSTETRDRYPPGSR